MATIKNLDELLKPHLGHTKKFVSYQAKSLLPPGENYGSDILKADIKVLDENYEVEMVNAIAKVAPSNDMLAEMFNTKVTFGREIEMYRTVFPIINSFASERGVPHLIDFVAKYYGGRISLNPEATEADKDAVLLLENLAEDGYETVDRYTGFDLAGTKIVLEDLAKLHGGVIAHKMSKPEEFKHKIKSIVSKNSKSALNDEVINSFIKMTTQALSPENQKYSSKIEESFKCHNELVLKRNQPQEPFGTIIHNDLWVNNTMLKFRSGKPLKNKMVDFQMVEYGTPASDLFLFLYTSVEVSVLKDNVDNLLRFYYDKLIETLTKLQIDTRPFLYEKLMEEMASFAIMEFAHILIMIKVANTKKGKMKEKSEMNITDLPNAPPESLHENYNRRLNFTVQNFVERGWI